MSNALLFSPVMATRGFAGLGDDQSNAVAADLLRRYSLPAYGYTMPADAFASAASWYQNMINTQGMEAALAWLKKGAADYIAKYPTRGVFQGDDRPPIPFATTSPTPPAAASGTGSTITLPIIGAIPTTVALIGAGVIAYFFLADG